MGQLTSRWRMTPVAADRRCAALRHHVDVQGPDPAPGDPAGRACRRASTTSTPATSTAAAGTSRTSRCVARPPKVQKTIGVAPITGESSPYYMFHPLAAGRIAADLPDARLLVLVRDPVERAYSGAHPRDRTALRDRVLRAGAGARTGADRRRRGAADRRPELPQLRSPAPQLSRPRALRRAARPAAGCRRPRPHPRRRLGPLLRRARGGLRRHHRVPAAAGLAPTRVQAAQLRVRAWTCRPELRTKLEEYFRPYDEKLTDWLGRAAELAEVILRRS